MSTLTRAAAARILAARRQDELVVPTMTPLAAWHALQQSELDILGVGAMGSASSMALGLALARPARKVWVLDGDGSLLMQLGSLATIASAAPGNFYHFVFHNGVYAFSGSQDVPGGRSIDFAGMARAAGYPATFVFDDAESFSTSLEEVLAKSGPVLVQLKLEPTTEDGLPLREIPLNARERGARLREILTRV
ncbi:MAG: thiamine pyrophosphate-binding protein [Dehalococcoidia bacterium]|nr:thiamine pyrophosphate-binding protein [Dehalococcoidia bacterium]